jgi:demethoxyubiquinone hydroxylase (CLK1/Coq7/Cat5 family)
MACIEYAKDSLNINELRSALKETTMHDEKHLAEVEKLIQKYGSDPKELKKQLALLEAGDFA